MKYMNIDSIRGKVIERYAILEDTDLRLSFTDNTNIVLHAEPDRHADGWLEFPKDLNILQYKTLQDISINWIEQDSPYNLPPSDLYRNTYDFLVTLHFRYSDPFVLYLRFESDDHHYGTLILENR